MRNVIKMAESMNDIMHPKADQDKIAAFPHAPEDWSEERALKLADEEGIKLENDHWLVIRFLQDYFSSNESPNARQLVKAMDERFDQQGGRKHLYRLFPRGPANQGCRIAGLESPKGSADKSFGSVQ